VQPRSTHAANLREEGGPVRQERGGRRRGGGRCD
jgi:hypothetical protein